MDKSTVSQMNDICQEQKVSPFFFAIYYLHHTIRAFSHGEFSVGIAPYTRDSDFRNTIGMFFNMLLVLFHKYMGCEG